VEGYDNDGLTFDVTDTGPSDGPVVIALHGFPEDRRCWEQVSRAMTDAKYRVLAPDQRGYSPGARPGGRRSYRVSLLAGEVLALADRAGARSFDVIGHDWGAVVAWHPAARHPDRVRTLTALSVPHPRAVASAMGKSSQVMHSWYMGFFQIPWLPERMLAQRGGSMLAASLSRSGLDSETARRYASRAASAAQMTGPINWYRALPFDARDPLGAVSVPSLYIWGTKDRFVTRAAAQRCGDFVTGGFRFIALEGQSHWLPTSAAREVAPLVLEHLGSVSYQ